MTHQGLGSEEDSFLCLKEQLRAAKNRLRMYENPPSICTMVVLVTGFQWHGYGISKHCRYQITRIWQGNNLCVYRRFSDFERLWEMLCIEFPGRIVPCLPTKVYVNSGGEDVVLERMEWLQVFVISILKRPVLAESQWFRDFLFLPTEEWQQKLDKISKVGQEANVLDHLQEKVSLETMRNGVFSALSYFPGFSSDKASSLDGALVKSSYRSLCWSRTPLNVCVPGIASRDTQENVRVVINVENGRAEAAMKVAKTLLELVNQTRLEAHCLVDVANSLKAAGGCEDMNRITENMLIVQNEATRLVQALKGSKEDQGPMQISMGVASELQGAVCAFQRVEQQESHNIALVTTELSEDLRTCTASYIDMMTKTMLLFVQSQIEYAQAKQRALHDTLTMFRGGPDVREECRTRLGLVKPRDWRWDVDTPM